MMTREMQRFIDGVAVHPTVFERGSHAHTGLAAIRDAAITQTTITAGTCKLFQVVSPLRNRRKTMEAAFRCIHKISDDVELS